MFGNPVIPQIKNEPLKNYEKGSVDRKLLLEACDELMKKPTEVPVVVDGVEYKTEKYQDFTMPGDHSVTLFRMYSATPELMKKAIDGALKAKEVWEKVPFAQKVAVFLRAAELLSTKYRNKLNAATMLGQGKTMYQAEIDSACEAIDFLRFNAYFAEKMMNVQPELHAQGIWNKMEYRPLEGFIVAVSPFNFTAIGTNLPCMPAQMGNVVLWKPSRTAALSNYFVYKLLEEAGLPKGVIQFLPTVESREFSKLCFEHPDFAGLHFTGSTATFQLFWKTIGDNLYKYKTYPRIVGETGGKNFHFLHPSANLDNFANNTVRGAFEYSGQKCSATSRAYIPESVWPKVKEMLIEKTKKIVVGKPQDPKSFTSSVIDQASFEKISGYIERAKKDSNCEIIVGGKCDSKEGWYVHPTIIVTKNPKSETMVEEIFGPVLTVYVYKDDEMEETIKLVDTTTPYGLTGSIFANDRVVIDKLSWQLRNAAGNFYVNDKSTGAVVWQQPFGGARASGTNDKAGSEFCLSRWVSIRSIKENFVPLMDFGYPSIDME